MSEQRKIGSRAVILEETPEQAAHAISAALDFLQIEANAIGMLDVSKLIGRARARANEFLASRVAGRCGSAAAYNPLTKRSSTRMPKPLGP